MDNIIFLFVILSIGNAVIKGIKKRMQAQNKVPGSEPFPGQVRKTEASKPVAAPKPAVSSFPKHAFFPSAAEQKPELKTQRAGLTEMKPQSAENQESKEGTSLDTGTWGESGIQMNAADAAPPLVPGIPLAFDRESLLQAVVMSEILKRPEERFREKNTRAQ